MNLLEYRAKQILNSFGISVPYGITADTAKKAVEAARKVQLKKQCKRWVIKAQVHTGGRGKAGGVQMASSLDEVESISKNMLGRQLVTHQTDTRGERVNLILIEEFMPLNTNFGEMYISLVLNRKKGCHSLVYSSYGGMDVEEISENHPEAIGQINFDRTDQISEELLEGIDTGMGMDVSYRDQLIRLINSLCKAYIESNALLLEINPLVITSDRRIMPLDAKMCIDDNALFLHPDIRNMHSEIHMDPLEMDARRQHLNYLKLSGNVACMVNGAGLAMATMDLISEAGGVPANFLDIGGTADSERVEKAFRILLSDSGVRLVFVNIFGGIVRCDRVATGIVTALQNLGHTEIPIIIRLQGTNVEAALEIISNSGAKVLVTDHLDVAGEMIRLKLGDLV